jgi:putative ABC transport system substrate-binding protein
MIRRLLLFALASVSAVLVDSAWGQQPARIPVVGLLITHAAVNDPTFEPLRTGLREYGYEEGRNIRLEIVTAAGQLDRLSGLAQQLVRQNVDVIIAPNEVSTRTARQATSTIPIVMVGFANDPVALGLVDSFARPGGNITGLCSLPGELDVKRLEILKEALPGVSRVAVFWEDPFGRGALEGLQRAAQSLDVRLEVIQLRGKQDLETAFKAARRKKAGAVLMVWSPTFYVQRGRVADLALKARLPTVAAFATENGALMSYGSNSVESWRRAAYYVDRLLKGAKPGDLPVEQVSKFSLVVNLKTAKALNVTLPESILLRADEVIR